MDHVGILVFNNELSSTSRGGERFSGTFAHAGKMKDSQLQRKLTHCFEKMWCECENTIVKVSPREVHFRCDLSHADTRGGCHREVRCKDLNRYYT